MGVEFQIIDSKVEQISKIVEESMELAVDAAGMQASSIAKTELQNNPSRIDTGLLRNSITWAVGGKTAAQGTYSASKPSQYDGKMPPDGYYGGSAPADEKGQKSAYIGTNVEYAPYVHEGTKRMAPNRFLKNAVERNKGELVQIISKVLREAVN